MSIGLLRDIGISVHLVRAQQTYIPYQLDTRLSRRLKQASTRDFGLWPRTAEVLCANRSQPLDDGMLEA